MAAQSDPSARLISFIGQRITDEIEIDGQKLFVQAQQGKLINATFSQESKVLDTGLYRIINF